MATAATATRLPIGYKFGPYQIERMLGEGGVAIVYGVRNKGGKPMALKVLKREAAQQAGVRACFEREYNVASRLAHAGIVHAVERGEIGGHVYITMPTVEGGSLATRLTNNKRLPVATALAIAHQVATALDHIHKQGLVHRDVKPANILLDEENRARLCDFGLAINWETANANDDEQLYGTPLYIAPEQAQAGIPLDGRADLYALGVVLYRMIAGRAPFYGLKEELLHAHIFEAPPRPSRFSRTTSALDGLILKALAKDPADRFQSGAEFAAALADPELSTAPVCRYRFPRLLRWLRAS